MKGRECVCLKIWLRVFIEGEYSYKHLEWSLLNLGMRGGGRECRRKKNRGAKWIKIQEIQDWRQND